MQCDKPISEVLDLACKTSLGFADARVTVDPKQGPALQLGPSVDLFQAV